MPKWLQKMIAPTLMLWLTFFAYGIAWGLASEGVSWRVELVAKLALSLAVGAWVIADARKRGRRLCYDYDSFLYFAWPVVAPVYLFQTRGLRAILTLLCFVGIWLMATLAGGLMVVFREFAPG